MKKYDLNLKLVHSNELKYIKITFESEGNNEWRVETQNIKGKFEKNFNLGDIFDLKDYKAKENFLNEFLQEKFGIFKGIVSDMYVDHFLCKNFENIFSGNPDFENVKKVERKIIKNIEKYDKFFPNDFKNFFDWLKREKVLARYKDLDFLERVFLGMSKRVRKGEILRNAVCELKNNYEDFEEKSLKEFLFVKKETERQFGLVEDNKNT